MTEATAHAEMRQHASSGVSLAIARYAKEHAEARKEADAWADPTVKKFMRMSVDEISAEASRRLDQLEAWRERAQREFPEVWEQDRVAYLQTQLSLQSAKTGHFETATGGLHDFLVSVGAPVDELDEH
jgi:hypothetical protein